MSREAPTAVLQAAVSRIVGALADKKPAPDERFVPAAAFSGPKPGFYFSAGPEGLGYVLAVWQLRERVLSSPHLP